MNEEDFDPGIDGNLKDTGERLARGENLMSRMEAIQWVVERMVEATYYHQRLDPSRTEKDRQIFSGQGFEALFVLGCSPQELAEIAKMNLTIAEIQDLP